MMMMLFAKLVDRWFDVVVIFAIPVFSLFFFYQTKMVKSDAGKKAEGAHEGLRSYYADRILKLEATVRAKSQNLRRLEAQRNDLNSKVCI